MSPLLPLLLVLICNEYGMARKILVTGAAGFVGSHVADRLLQMGDQVVIVDEMNDYYDIRIKESNLKELQVKHGSDNLWIHVGDICDVGFMDEVFRLHHFDAICHLAARAGVRPSISDPFIYVHSNIKATVELMERAARLHISNFVFASSSSVYGGSRSKLFSETESVDRPISPYAATKRSCELFGEVYHQLYGLRVTALRFFTVYGPRGRVDMAPFKFIDRISRGQMIQQYGDGSTSRDYTFISDIVEGVVTAIDRHAAAFRVINLGRGSGTSLRQFLKTVETQVGKPAKVEILPDQPGDVPYTCANVTLAKQWLNYSAVVPISEGLQQTVGWYRDVYERQFPAMLSKAKEESSSSPDKAIQPKQKRGRNNVVLVTRGGSILGLKVVEVLLQRGYKVVVAEAPLEESTSFTNANLEALVRRKSKARLSVVRGDLANTTLLRSVFEQESPELVCHLSTESSEKSHPIGAINRTIDSTLALLDVFKGTQHGAFEARNFVITTSDLASNHEKNERNGGEESNVSHNSAMKKTEELLAHTYSHLYGLPVSILRLSALAAGQREEPLGPHQDDVETKRPSISEEYLDYVADSILRALENPKGYGIIDASDCVAEEDGRSRSVARFTSCSMFRAQEMRSTLMMTVKEQSPPSTGTLGIGVALPVFYTLRTLVVSQWAVLVFFVAFIRCCSHHRRKRLP